jgi:hypothetical protein
MGRDRGNDDEALFRDRSPAVGLCVGTFGSEGSVVDLTPNPPN